jgi:hypothetical protein
LSRLLWYSCSGGAAAQNRRSLNLAVGPIAKFSVEKRPGSVPGHQRWMYYRTEGRANVSPDRPQQTAKRTIDETTQTLGHFAASVLVPIRLHGDRDYSPASVGVRLSGADTDDLHFLCPDASRRVDFSAYCPDHARPICRVIRMVGLVGDQVVGR